MITALKPLRWVGSSKKDLQKMPAEVQDVVVLDGGKRQALAIVPEQQLSLAIGKQGLNVRLANRLVDWNIDVKTEAQFSEMDVSLEISRAATDLFSGIGQEEEEITRIGELPDISERLVALLKENGIELIETLIILTAGELAGLTGLTPVDVDQIQKIIEDNVEIIESEEEVLDDGVEAGEPTDGAEDEVETYECPECEKPITADMNICPNCGVGLSFEIEEVEEQEE